MAKESKAQEKFHIELVKQLVALSTTGFGLVAALAWNSLIQELVNEYIKKFFPKGSGIISLFLYAILITVLAVFITYQLSHLSEKLRRQR